jgi:UDP-2-acetamido-2-deoxy-ribo-hexuluronate aminotransferase
MVDLKAQHRAIAEEVLPRVLDLVAAQTFILGAPVLAFERTLTRLAGTTQAVGVASGTDALVLSLRALGIGPGDLVVVPAFGFVASAEAVCAVGARPLFADVRDFLLDAAGVEACLREASGGTVRAMIPVHLFGECAPMTELSAVAKAHRLVVVEDAAQAILATDEGRLAGSMGALGALSFFPSKNLGAWGDGGAVVGSSDALLQRVRSLRAHGLTGEGIAEIGTNSRLDALQAVVLEAKSKYLEPWTLARGRVADRYRAELGLLEGRVRLPPLPRTGCRHVYNQFVIRVRQPDPLAVHLASRGVETRRYYPRALSMEPAFAPFAHGRRFVAAEDAAGSSLGLPIHPELTDDQQRHVVDSIRDFLR